MMAKATAQTSGRKKNEGGRKKNEGGREEIVGRLLDLFRRAGFEGVSLSDISKATGLGKSSLYHHFPGGKTDMAEAVLSRVSQWSAAKVTGPLLAQGNRAERIGPMLDSLEQLYGGGREPCIIASLLVGGEEPGLQEGLRQIVKAWIDALAKALTETGAAPPEAKAQAVDALSRIQGALVLSRALGDPSAFKQAMARVRGDLLA
jgi:TetR/AcrR family transcriptional repressor of lmrAB and yxaGH operons